MSIQPNDVAESMIKGSLIHRAVFHMVSGGLDAVNVALEKLGFGMVYDEATQHYLVRQTPETLAHYQEAHAKLHPAPELQMVPQPQPAPQSTYEADLAKYEAERAAADAAAAQHEPEAVPYVEPEPYVAPEPEIVEEHKE